MSMQQIRFDDQVILVTGAGRGLGRAQALLLASRGAKVVVADNGSAMHGGNESAALAEQVVREIADAGGEGVACTVDLSTVEGSVKAVSTALEAYGRMDGLIHLASTCPDLRPPDELVDHDVEMVLTVNPFAAIWMARAAWRHMMERGYGRIVLVPSAALYGALGNTPYAAAKAALIGIVRCLALEGAEHGIRVNGVMPAALTRMTETFLPPDYLEWFAREMPPEKVATGVAWLASEACTANGEIFAMGGGRIARVALAEAEGVTDCGGSIEQVHDAMPQVMADTSFFYPRDLAERTAKVSTLLARKSQSESKA